MVCMQTNICYRECESSPRNRVLPFHEFQFLVSQRLPNTVLLRKLQGLLLNMSLTENEDTGEMSVEFPNVTHVKFNRDYLLGRLIGEGSFSVVSITKIKILKYLVFS